MCGLCKIVKDLTPENFLNNKRNKVGLSYCCRDCKGKVHYFRKNLIEKSQFKCNNCGIYNGDISFFDIDHKKPILRKTNKLKGRDDIIKSSENELSVLCPNCHRLKTIKNKEFSI